MVAGVGADDGVGALVTLGGGRVLAWAMDSGVRRGSGGLAAPDAISDSATLLTVPALAVTDGNGMLANASGGEVGRRPAAAGDEALEAAAGARAVDEELVPVPRTLAGAPADEAAWARLPGPGCGWV